MNPMRIGLAVTLTFTLVIAGKPSAGGGESAATPTSSVESDLSHLLFYTPEDMATAYSTAEEIITITDPARERDIELRITAPVVNVPNDSEQVNQQTVFPLVVFSHGLGGSNNAFPEAAKLWASAGYVVIMPTHADSGMRSILRMGRGKGPLFDPAMWEGRVLDQVAILDQLEDIQQTATILRHAAIDAERIASAGHSFGSQTASVMAGAVLTRPDGSTIEMRDERIDVAIPISVQLPGQIGYTESSYRNMTIPLLNITGTNDRVGNGATGYARARVFDRYPAGDKHLLFIDDAAHSSFQDRSSMNRATRRVTRTGNDPEVDRACALHTRLVALAFLDAYLKDDPFAKAWLMTDGPEAIGSSTATWKSR